MNYGEHIYAFGNLWGDCRIAIEAGSVWVFDTNGNPVTRYVGGGHLGWWLGSDFENVQCYLDDLSSAPCGIDIESTSENQTNGYWPVTNFCDNLGGLYGTFSYMDTTAGNTNYWPPTTKVKVQNIAGYNQEVIDNYENVSGNLTVGGSLSIPQINATVSAAGVWQNLQSAIGNGNQSIANT